MFTGPKGIGKTSSARILAKTLGCLERKGVDACGRCDVCRETDRGANLDILEIDAASNRGIDDVRQLRDKVGLRPIKAKAKVYIIDEVHMLTNEAFNAILKTLEEPPDHVYFIFCTTDPEKIPETVRSRLLMINFPRASDKEVIDCLKRVVVGEKLEIKKESLGLIARFADGSFRDAHKLLYQLVISEGKKINPKRAEEFLGKFNILPARDLVEMILKGEREKALRVTRKLEHRGADFNDYLKRCLGRVQKLILAKAGVEDGAGLGIQVDNWEMDQLIDLSKAVAGALREQKTTTIASLPLQILIASWPKQPGGGGPTKEREGKTKIKNKLAKNKDLQKKNKPSVGLESKTVVLKNKLDMSLVRDKWDQLVLAVKPLNHSVSALLRACHPVSTQGDRLTIGVFYKFHKERLEEGKNRKIMEEGIRKVFGLPYQVYYVLTQRQKQGTEKLTEATKQAAKASNDEMFEAAKEIFG